MSKTILSIFRMFSYGLGSIQFVKKRDYGQAMSKNANQAAYERWLTLGKRFRNSMNKVVGQYVKA